MELSKDTISRLVEKVVSEIPLKLNLDQNLLREIATIYFSSVDKEGFVFDFDQVYKWAGYKKKSNAKRILTGKRGKFKFIEGRDYLINSSNNFINEKSKNDFPNKETIMMTQWTFNKFCLSVNTTKGYYLQTIVLASIRVFQDFLKEVECGNLSVIQEKRNTEINNKRIKVANSNKELMDTIKLKKPKHCSAYGLINGMTNKAVTGRSENETAALLGKKSKEINIRDHMTKPQLIAAELIETISNEINEYDTRDSIEIHQEVTNEYTPICKLYLHGKIAQNPLKLDKAMKTILAIQDKNEKKRNFHGIENYFIKK
ncbi:MAG: hypothetical protein GY823_03065 [Flavobacteriaceae bacterium]|nr:hypothetical protein [Flavobacteriaceae bacterium]